MNKNFLMMLLIALSPLASNVLLAQVADGFKEDKESPIEKLAYEEGTGEIRGYGQSISARAQLALSAAKSQATADLQQKVEQYVRYGLNQYFDETGVNDASNLDEKTRNDVVVAAKGVIEGAVVLKTRRLYNKTTRKYMYEVCMKYDKAGILSAMEAQSARILQNRAKFEQDMQDAWDELDERNSRMTVAEKRAAREERINAIQQDNLDRQNQRDINLEEAKSKNAATQREIEEAAKDRDALRKAATNRTKKKVVTTEYE